MILSDRDITYFAQEHGLIQPFVSDNVQPASIDVTLGWRFMVFDGCDQLAIDLDDPADITKVVDVKPPDGRFVLHPGEFVLGHTIEYVTVPADLVGRVEGKSSLGRLGLIVHATAGYIDPGFRGRITLEMSNLLKVPIVLRPGKLIAQLSFQQMLSSAKDPYDGRYQGDDSVAPSRYGR